jgi:hypothetical protein
MNFDSATTYVTCAKCNWMKKTEAGTWAEVVDENRVCPECESGEDTTLDYVPETIDRPDEEYIREQNKMIGGA